MGRGKVQLKRIEDKSSRHVTFSKRKSGLIKKAGELAVLCDVELALVIFSSRGKLYQFSSGQSLRKILERYLVHVEEEAVVCTSGDEAKIHGEFMDLWKGTSLQELVGRHIEGQNIEHLNLTQLIQLEMQLDSILRQMRDRKTQVMMDTVAELQEKEKQLRQDNYVLEKKIAARMDIENGERANEDPHSNSYKPPLQRGLLHLF
ncbi:MADS-box transcription factor 14-like isoform X2 [Durio zibethinus]|uniref:MADS-box transcription factor 14-like isoform X2 n=1 Tax=Durio zibethinus TaxID=66656 RepID=A0A6P5YGG6_DURZI|nr:MADS-box transcription factor 14-like isoform X2 [Durio zibethinus]